MSYLHQRTQDNHLGLIAVDDSAVVGHAATPPLPDFIAGSRGMQRVRDRISKYGRADRASVLIFGETGTGKELVARALHAASPRASQPFVAVNCAAVPDTLIEGELFGYQKGAFTGALRTKLGYFALAHKGTLFLDEIGDLSLSAQAKVLRVLQELEIYPLGAQEPMAVDVRVIAATHKDLRREVREGRFRDDLFFRIHVLTLELPPLRERGADVEVLAHVFLERFARQLGRQLDGFTDDALAALVAYPWPGNVRELESEVLRAAVDTDGPWVGLGDLTAPVRHALDPISSGDLPESGESAPPGSGPLAARFAALEPMERSLVEEALALARDNISEAARLLGISRNALRRRVERFGLRDRDG